MYPRTTSELATYRSPYALPPAADIPVGGLGSVAVVYGDMAPSVPGISMPDIPSRPASPYAVRAHVPAGVRLGRGLGTTTVSTTGGMLALWLIGAGLAGAVLGAGVTAYVGANFLR